MAFTRKMLKAMGIEDEKIEQLIEAHTEVVDALKADRDTYKEDANKLKDVQKELDGLKAKADDGWKEKHDTLKVEFEKFKSDIEADKTKASKERAARAFYESKNITGKNLEIAMRGSRAEIEALELDGENFKDVSTLEALVAGDFSGLVYTSKSAGVTTAKPPANNGTGTGKTKEEIMAIKDGTLRRAEMAKNPHLFGLSEN
jgi:predicted RNase H-like nuclease (RuvC/YqgF family)